MLKSFRRAIALSLSVFMLTSSFAFGGFALPVSADPVKAATPIYLDTNYSFAERAADMVARMTLAQKTSQMVSSLAAAVPAGDDSAGTVGTGVRTYAYWNEALHGYSANGATDAQNPAGITNATSYPIETSLGQTWDPSLVYRVTSAISDEIRERAPGLDSNLNFYSPVVEPQRDPRWGRNSETWGEDPVLNAKLASQFINGFEGLKQDGKTPIDPNGYYKANATIKHYLANDSENNRLQGVSNLTEQENREYYSAVYRDIIKWSKPASVMASYNRLQIAHAAYWSNFYEMPDGINFYTLDTMLRQTFGFQGYVTGDCDAANTAGSTGNGVTGTTATQGVSAGSYSNVGHSWRAPSYTWYNGPTKPAMTATISAPQIAAWGVMGGEDLECNQGVAAGKTYQNNNPNGTVDTPFGTYTEQAVDVSLAKILEGRFRVGEWDDKTNYSAAPTGGSSTDPLGNSTGRVTWYDQAKQRVVQNYGLSLPATAAGQVSAGSSTMTTDRANLVSEAAAKSLVLLKNDGNLLPMQIPSTGSFSVGVYGTMSASNATVILGQYSATNSSSGKQTNLFNGISAAIKAKNPNATVTSAGTSYTAASTGADQYDYVIALVGDVGGTGYAAEQRDRPDFALSNSSGGNSGNTDQVTIQNLYAANKKLIVVMTTSCAIGEADSTTNMFGSIPALLASSFLGDQPGVGVGKVLVGDENPSARTNATWYPVSSAYSDNSSTNNASINQIRSYRLSPGTDGPWQSPLYGTTTTLYPTAGPYTFTGYNRGRTYMYYNGAGAQAPRFPFGYGLSYTTFAYSNPVVTVNGVPQTGSSINANPNDKIQYSFTVKNTGTVAGADVAQLYVKTPADVYALSDSGPQGESYAIKRLKDFAKTDVLAPGATQTVTLSVNVPDIAFWSNADAKFELTQLNDPYVLQVSRSADDSFTYNGQDCGVQLSTSLHINNAANWQPEVSVVSFKPNTPEDAAANIPQRLIYNAGDTVTPNPTVCMANDVLYGYINALYSSATDQKYPMPSNITVTYTSNRPNIVSVSGGTVKAIHAGVATITGTAYDSLTGTSASANFVVYVEAPPPQLASIEVGGVPLANFAKDTYSYTLNYDMPLDTAPVVTATPAFDTYTVDIKQAAAIPGTATVTVSDGTADTVYTINFALTPPRLATLAVGGTAVPGFSPNTFSYTLNYDAASDTAPLVTASSSVQGQTVDIKQAAAIPGSATVTVSNAQTSQVYTIIFSIGPKSDSFVAGKMDDQWTILNPDPSNYSLVKGQGLRLPTLEGDIYGANRAWNNAFVRDASGDWEVVSKIFFPAAPNATYQQIALFAWGDEDNYVKLGCEASSTTARVLQLMYESAGTDTTVGTNVTATSFNNPDGSLTLWLKLKKSGNNFTGAYSRDGVTYSNVPTAGTAATLAGISKIGLFATKNTAVSSSSPVIDSYCEYVTFTQVNGATVMTYPEMMQNAVNNVRDYVAADIPAVTTSNIVYDRMPREYSISAVSGNTDVISNAGVVTRQVDDVVVPYQITISDGTRTAAATINITVPGLGTSFTYGGQTFYVQNGVSDYDISVPNSKTNITSADFSAANVSPQNAANVNVSVVLTPANGAVSAGAPCKAAITIANKDGTGTPAVYNVWFGHLTVTAPVNINYMGFNSSANVRFGDGATSFMMIQAFYKNGQLVMINPTQIDPIPLNESGTIHAATSSDIDMTGLTVKVFVWDKDYTPLAPASSTWS